MAACVLVACRACRTLDGADRRIKYNKSAARASCCLPVACSYALTPQYLESSRDLESSIITRAALLIASQVPVPVDASVLGCGVLGGLNLSDS